jgi:hypothetical protein
VDKVEATALLDQLYNVQSGLRDLLLEARRITQSSPLSSAEEDAVLAELQTLFDNFDMALLPVQTSYVDWVYNLLHTT